MCVFGQGATGFADTNADAGGGIDKDAARGIASKKIEGRDGRGWHPIAAMARKMALN